MKGTLECFMQANNNSAALSSFPPLVHYPLPVAVWFVFFLIDSTVFGAKYLMV